MKLLGKNWKTTLAGVLGLATLVGTSAGWLTHDQAHAIGAALASFGLIAASDGRASGGSPQ